MQEKKANSNIDVGIVKISIRDGYQDGDALNLDLSGINYTWNVEQKELVISSDAEHLNINNILEKVSLNSTEQNDTERFVSVEYITEEGESISLKEYVLNKQDDAQEEYELEHNDTSYIFASPEDDVLFEEIFAFDYEESKGADFLESSIEESIPFEVSLDEDGDIYKILKDSFSQGQEFFEIHGYDISQDKVSLEDFSREFGGAFDYKVLADNDDLNVNIYVENQEYSVVLKDVISDSDTGLDEIIQNLIINNGEHKI